MPVTIYFLPSTEKEVHMMGEYVGVFWNLRKKRETRTMIGPDNITYSAQVETLERRNGPHIRFFNIRYDTSAQEHYEDDDPPISGGITISGAQEIAHELLAAVEYIEHLQSSSA